jgi:hypothetical protein
VLQYKQSSISTSTSIKERTVLRLRSQERTTRLPVTFKLGTLALQAFWRLFEYPTHQEFPPVQHLAIHLPGQHTVCFADDLSPEQIADRAVNARSTLMAFFEYDATHEDGRQYLYHEFPQHIDMHGPVHSQKSFHWHL